MPIVSVSQGEIYYEEHGSGRPVVLAHGIGGNHAIWFQQLPALSKQFRVITFDHRGFGNSADSGRLGRASFVADLRALLDHLEIEKTSLVGQSMGGGTVLGFTARYPERTTALVMCDSLHGFVESDDVAAIMTKAREKTMDLSQLDRVLGTRIRNERPDKAALYQQLNSFNAANRSNLPGAFTPLVSPQELADTGIPVLFLVGEYDVLFPSRAVKHVHGEVPGSQYLEFANVGHSAFYEAPDLFNEAVSSFILESTG